MFALISAMMKFVFYQPLFNIMMVLYRLFGGNLGLAIIGIAFLAKIITIPITRKQLKSAEQMKEFQDKTNRVKEKFAKEQKKIKNEKALVENKEKMNNELMKLSSEYMPAQLGGCLPLIISIILLIQIRYAVINLVNQGFHAFNEVAYVEALKFPEDSVKFTVEGITNAGVTEEGFEKDIHEIGYKITATNGAEVDDKIDFFLVENEDQGEEKIDKYNDLKDERSDEEVKEDKDHLLSNRDAGIAVFIKNFEEGNYVLSENVDFEIFLRPPSNEGIEKVEIFIDGEKVENLDIDSGEKLDLDFLGLNLSRAGSDFAGDWEAFAPYLILAIFLGITQFGIGKIQTGIGKLDTKKNEPNKKNNKDKKEKDNNEEPDFSEIMQQSSRQMIYVMPIMTITMSLGYIGGAHIFPAAVSLFWTVQNGFVIIQLAISKREELFEYLKSRFGTKSDLDKT